jgi:hypothetical protein
MRCPAAAPASNSPISQPQSNAISINAPDAGIDLAPIDDIPAVPPVPELVKTTNELRAINITRREIEAFTEPSEFSQQVKKLIEAKIYLAMCVLTTNQVAYEHRAARAMDAQEEFGIKNRVPADTRIQLLLIAMRRMRQVNEDFDETLEGKRIDLKVQAAAACKEVASQPNPGQ